MTIVTVIVSMKASVSPVANSIDNKICDVFVGYIVGLGVTVHLHYYCVTRHMIY